MNTATILVVDDEPQLRRAMKATLTDLGYVVMEAKTGEEALEVLRHDPADLILLDLNMPGIGGLETCRAIRETSELPIIVLSVRNTERDKVEALDAGADDYVTKPFSIQELQARVRAQLRRRFASQPEAQQVISLGDFVIDIPQHRVLVRGQDVHLTPKQFDLLVVLAQHAGQVLTHRALLHAVWGSNADQPEYLRVNIGQLRKKIETSDEPHYIITEPWIGYRFRPMGKDDI